MHETAASYQEPLLDEFGQPVLDEWGEPVMVDVPPTYAPLSNVKVTVFAPKSTGAPGKVVSSTTTGADGTFTVAGLTAPVCVQVNGNPDWQMGWYAGPSSLAGWAAYVQDIALADCTVAADAALGDLQIMSALASGRVVAQNGTGTVPVVGATVKYVPADTTRGTLTAVTDASGYYSFTGLNYDEYEVRVSAKRAVSGYVGANCVVVTNPGDAVTYGTGPIGWGENSPCEITTQMR